MEDKWITLWSGEIDRVRMPGMLEQMKEKYIVKT